MKILLNSSVGGFGLSEEALQLMHKAGVKGIVKTNTSGVREEHQIIFCDPFEFERNDPDAVKIVEEIGTEAASGDFCIIEIAEIPDDVKRWDIIGSDSGFENLIYGDYEWYE